MRKVQKKTKQLKDKIWNLKDAYKAARDNIKKTGASPTYSPYFEDFDEVLGTRDVINTPFAREVGVLNQDDISDDGGKGNLILFRISLKAGKGVQSWKKGIQSWKVFIERFLRNECW